MKRLNNHGDTIVEVLIAMLVVSVILSGAFVSARRSQTAIRSTQERVEALKVAEGQVEQLKAAAVTGAPNIFQATSGTDVFCVSGTNKPAVTLKPLASDAFDGYGACKSASTGVDYYYLVERTVSGNTFVVYTRWEGVNGTGKQEVKLAVRIDP